MASATVTPSGGTTPSATPTRAATGYYSDTGGTANVAGLTPAQAKQSGSSIWDLFTIDAAAWFALPDAFRPGVLRE